MADRRPALRNLAGATSDGAGRRQDCVRSSPRSRGLDRPRIAWRTAFGAATTNVAGQAVATFETGAPRLAAMRDQAAGQPREPDECRQDAADKCWNPQGYRGGLHLAPTNHGMCRRAQRHCTRTPDAPSAPAILLIDDRAIPQFGQQHPSKLLPRRGELHLGALYGPRQRRVPRAEISLYVRRDLGHPQEGLRIGQSVAREDDSPVKE